MRINKYWLIIAAGIMLDAITKTMVVAKCSGGALILAKNWTQISIESILIKPITSFFNMVLVFNRGVSFSMFYSNNPNWKFVLLTFGLAITCFLIFLFRRENRNSNKIFLAIAIAGALGNVIDRIRFGAVVDFLDFHLGNFHWPAFNVADMMIVCGISLLVLNSLFRKD